MSNNTTHTIIQGDSRKMSEIPDKSVHLIITSPPYWQLKDYGTDDQIGFNDSYEEWNTYFNGHWYFNGAKQDKHLAMFPEELPKRLIKMFSFPQETVLDPFMGSGTTASVAQKLNRNSVGYEINPDFIPLIQEKIGSNNLYDAPEIAVIKQTTGIDFKQEIDSLPYKFVDVHKIDKKIDVKKLQ